MKGRQFFYRMLLGCITVFCFMAEAKAQTNQPEAVRWLEKAGPVPEFVVPGSRVAWEKKRKEVRAELMRLLGKLPPRPKVAGGRNPVARGQRRLHGGEIPVR